MQFGTTGTENSHQWSSEKGANRKFSGCPNSSSYSTDTLSSPRFHVRDIRPKPSLPHNHSSSPPIEPLRFSANHAQLKAPLMSTEPLGKKQAVTTVPQQIKTVEEAQAVHMDMLAGPMANADPVHKKSWWDRLRVFWGPHLRRLSKEAGWTAINIDIDSSAGVESQSQTSPRRLLSMARDGCPTVNLSCRIETEVDQEISTQYEDPAQILLAPSPPPPDESEPMRVEQFQTVTTTIVTVTRTVTVATRRILRPGQPGYKESVQDFNNMAAKPREEQNANLEKLNRLRSYSTTPADAKAHNQRETFKAVQKSMADALLNHITCPMKESLRRSLTFPMLNQCRYQSQPPSRPHGPQQAQLDTENYGLPTPTLSIVEDTAETRRPSKRRRSSTIDESSSVKVETGA